MTGAGPPPDPQTLRTHALTTRAAADARAYLFSLSPSTIRLGLERMQRALSALGNPQAQVPALHVAGTNGKGSTCAFAASCLGQKYRVGLYTSPHLVRFNERIQVGGREIDDETLGQRVLEVLDRLPVDHELTAFEFGTLVAFWHFAQEKVDLAVLETGLGGRLDATTCCRAVVTTITSLSLDHTAYLGETLAAIAGEKAGICKRHVPLVTCVQAPEAAAVLAARARELEAPLFVDGREFELLPSTRGYSFSGLSGRVDGLSIPLAGAHQVQNAALALASLEVLAERGFRLTPEAVRQGLAATRWPGRLEEFSGPVPVVLDGAHNPDGVRTLIEGLARVYPGRPVFLVFGVLADKDSDVMIRALFPKCAAVFLAPVDNPAHARAR